MKLSLISICCIFLIVLAAIADDLYISEAGDVWQTLPGLPYYYQIMNDRYVLFEEGVETSIFEFPPDPLAERTLRNNLEIQSKALERTLKDHEAWLEWAGPAQYVSKDIRNEIREMKKLKVLQAVFAELKAQKSQANSLVNTEVTASVPCLVPGVCLTKSGRILLRQKRDAQIRYVAYAGLLGIQGSTLTEEDGLAVSETIPADERLTRFLKLVLQNKVNKTKPGGSRAFSSSW